MIAIAPDQWVVLRFGPLAINATLAFTWAVMLLLVGGAWLVTRRLATGAQISRWQNLLEVLVTGIGEQIRAVSKQQSRMYLPFVGTLFLFIAVSNLLAVVPGYRPPTGSLSTTTALAICVFVAVPVFGIARQGLRRYLSQYTRPSVLMLPFNVVGEISRTLALAVRLFGNVMSGALLAAILLALTPLFFPVLLHALGLLTGLVQAYVFAILALIYVASGTRTDSEREAHESLDTKEGPPS